MGKELLTAKTCNECGGNLPSSEYWKRAANKNDGLDSKCITCSKIYARQRRDKNPVAYKEYRREKWRECKALMSASELRPIRPYKPSRPDLYDHTPGGISTMSSRYTPEGLGITIEMIFLKPNGEEYKIPKHIVSSIWHEEEWYRSKPMNMIQARRIAICISYGPGFLS